MSLLSAIVGAQNVFGPIPSYCPHCEHCRNQQTILLRMLQDDINRSKQLRREEIAAQIARRKIRTLSQMEIEKW